MGGEGGGGKKGFVLPRLSREKKALTRYHSSSGERLRRHWHDAAVGRGKEGREGGKGNPPCRRADREKREEGAPSYFRHSGHGWMY